MMSRFSRMIYKYIPVYAMWQDFRCDSESTAAVVTTQSQPGSLLTGSLRLTGKLCRDSSLSTVIRLFIGGGHIY